MFDHLVLVYQHPHAKALKLGNPRGGTRVVLVIVGNPKDAMACTHVAQRRDMRTQVLYVNVHQIARHGNEIRMQGVEPLYHAHHIVALESAQPRRLRGECAAR
nr:hypothetical protein [Ralstonia solanacearum]